METGATPALAATNSFPRALYRSAYRLVAYFGLMTIFGALLHGFRVDRNAAQSNYAFDLGLYAFFLVPHLLMTRSWWKQRIWGHPAGMPRERRLYIGITLLTWFAVLALHRPVPGPVLDLHSIVRFAGTMAFLASFLLFFQGITFEMLDGLLGVPGAQGSYTHGAATPLHTQGAYAEVRHPMYRAAVLAGLSSLLIHPSLGQLFWVALVAGTFVAFIPVEEAQLVRARGDDYRKYREQTPHRLFRGIW